MFETAAELLDRIALGEDSVLELKAVAFKGDKVVGPHRDGMADELAAMANAASGVVVLGVDDKTRQVSGIPPEKLDLAEAWLRELCADLIEPPLDCVIRKLALPDHQGNEKYVLRIDVPRSLFVHKSNILEWNLQNRQIPV